MCPSLSAPFVANQSVVFWFPNFETWTVGPSSRNINKYRYQFVSNRTAGSRTPPSRRVRLHIMATTAGKSNTCSCIYSASEQQQQQQQEQQQGHEQRQEKIHCRSSSGSKNRSQVGQGGCSAGGADMGVSRGRCTVESSKSHPTRSFGRPAKLQQ